MSESNDPQLISLSDFSALNKAIKKRRLLSLALELTHRCNNNCVHCYINLSANDKKAKKNELSFEDIKDIVNQAFSMETLWVLLSGGEPLLRDDFCDIYIYLKEKGFLVSIFTNASLISKEHIEVFKKYPPRDIEVSVYGISEITHKRITRKNTFTDTMKGIERLINSPLSFVLKTAVMQSNHKEFLQISEFCKKATNRPFKFDPFLTLRLDRNLRKNSRIIKERLSVEEIIELEKLDKNRSTAIKKQCLSAGTDDLKEDEDIFRCRAGINSGCIDCYGNFKLCSSLVRKECIYDLKNGSLADAWNNFTPHIRMKKSADPLFKKHCGSCSLVHLCMWCPAHSDLETGELDKPAPYFCDTALKRYSYFNSDMP
nr:radical SAM protein [Desulfobacula sp.]